MQLEPFTVIRLQVQLFKCIDFPELGFAIFHQASAEICPKCSKEIKFVSSFLFECSYYSIDIIRHALCVSKLKIFFSLERLYCMEPLGGNKKNICAPIILCARDNFLCAKDDFLYIGDNYIVIHSKFSFAASCRFSWS